jgi:hypothetical protein
MTNIFTNPLFRNVTFDKFNQYEKPTWILCQPDKTQLYSLGMIYDRKLNLRYNTLSEISFTIPYKTMDQVNPAYDLVDYRRMIYIEDIGYFMITEWSETNDGMYREKIVKGQSQEVELSFKKLSLFKGTYQFYSLDPAVFPNTLLGQIQARLPGWNFSFIDSSLWDTGTTRTFNVTDTTIYSFLMNEVSQAYQCIFTFEPITKTISAQSTTDAIVDTDIYLSYDNLIEKVTIKQITNELVTALTVYGAGNLAINAVNPIGTNTIYDFSYFKNSNWMSSGLVTAITNWETKLNNYLTVHPTYGDLLTNIKSNNASYLTLSGSLNTLIGDYNALEAVRKARVDAGISFTGAYVDKYGVFYSSLTDAFTAKNSQLTTGSANVWATQVTGKNLTTQQTAINLDLSLSNTNNFTPTQQSELSSYIFGSTYQNNNFVQYDTMTLVQIQDEAQKLYDQAKLIVLPKVSQPRYEFELNAVNFIFLKEYQTFISQLGLGSKIKAELSDGNVSSILYLGLDLNYDDPNDFKMIFSNRLRLDGSAFEFSDLFTGTTNSATNTSFNSDIWSSFNTTYKNPVSAFITSALDASKNNVISAQGQEILINSNGIQGRAIPISLDSNGNPIPSNVGGTPVYISGSLAYYKDAQGNPIYGYEKFWLTNNTFAFTRDNWATASLALGKIVLPSGTAGAGNSVYGIVADAIIGKMFIGNSMLIQSDTGKFTFDNSGATLTDATLTLTTTTGESRIIMNPTDGLRMQGRPSGGAAYEDRIWIGTDGNANFKGNITAVSGTFSGVIYSNEGSIGGWGINSSGITGNSGNYINNNGTFSLGNGKIGFDGITLTVDGNITARSFNTNNQAIIPGTSIISLTADKITAGTMSADRIYGGKITWSGGKLDMSIAGAGTITSTGVITVAASPTLNSSDATAQMVITSIAGGGDIKLDAKTVSIGSFVSSGRRINMIGPVYSTNLYITSDGNNDPLFKNSGILTSNDSGVTYKKGQTAFLSVAGLTFLNFSNGLLFAWG